MLGRSAAAHVLFSPSADHRAARDHRTLPILAAMAAHDLCDRVRLGGLAVMAAGYSCRDARVPTPMVQQWLAFPSGRLRSTSCFCFSLLSAPNLAPPHPPPYDVRTPCRLQRCASLLSEQHANLMGPVQQPCTIPCDYMYTRHMSQFVGHITVQSFRTICFCH